MFVVITDLNGTTKSPKSQRLKERKRKNQACTNKLSPGLIFSDSEEEADLNFQSKNILNVVDVCSNRELFSTFIEELKEQKTILDVWHKRPEAIITSGSVLATIDNKK